MNRRRFLGFIASLPLVGPIARLAAQPVIDAADIVFPPASFFKIHGAIIYVALHSSAPDTELAPEASYGEYARVAISRGPNGWSAS
jgi:hypothetical protein